MNDARHRATVSETTERVEQVRDLVWRLKSGVRANEARVVAIADYLAEARGRAAELRTFGQIPEGSPLNATSAISILQELETSHEELNVADEELRIRAEQLARWEKEATAKLGFHRRLFEHAPVAFFVTDEHGVIADANRAATDLLNVPLRFLQGKPIINFVARRDVRHVRTFVHSIVRSDDALKANITFRPRHGKGVIPTDVRATAIETGGALALGWLAREVPRASAAPDARTSEALRAIAGDLSAPLETIRSAVNELEELLTADSSPRARNACSDIAHSADELVKRVADLRGALSQLTAVGDES